MRFIGITGGVGAGKSEILSYLASLDGVKVMLADEIAHELMKPGTACYEKIRETFPEEDIYQPEGGFRRDALAGVIFADPVKRAENERNRASGSEGICLRDGRAGAEIGAVAAAGPGGGTSYRRTL